MPEKPLAKIFRAKVAISNKNIVAMPYRVAQERTAHTVRQSDGQTGRGLTDPGSVQP